MEITPYEITHDIPLCWTLPAPKTDAPLYFALGTDKGHSYPSYLRRSDNALCLYYPSYTTVERIDASIVYPVDV